MENKKRVIAIPVTNGMLDEHFGHCKQFAIIETNDHKILNSSEIEAPPHQPGLLPKWLAEKGVTDVIAGGMGQKAIQIFNHHNVNVFVGAPKRSAEYLTEGFLNKSISFAANYCDH